MMRTSLVFARLKKILIIIFLVFLFLIFNLYFVTPVRNLLLYPVWPYRWRTISTADLYTMLHPKLPEKVVNLKCETFHKRTVERDQVRSIVNFRDYKKINEENEFFKQSDNARFLMGVAEEDRTDFMWMYLNIANALKEANVPYMFVNGALLGVFRHAGSIPWDSDIDVSIHESHWEKVREVLSCIEGFHLQTYPFMAWKFFINGKDFPFIDLFFYTENDKYIWPLTYYEFNSQIYEKEDVYPRTTAIYEGIEVPVPARMDNLVRRQFEPEKCIPPSLNYKTFIRHSQKPVLCSSLQEVYPMQNLRY